MAELTEQEKRVLARLEAAHAAALRSRAQGEAEEEISPAFAARMSSPFSSDPEVNERILARMRTLG